MVSFIVVIAVILIVVFIHGSIPSMVLKNYLDLTVSEDRSINDAYKKILGTRKVFLVVSIVSSVGIIFDDMLQISLLLVFSVSFVFMIMFAVLDVLRCKKTVLSERSIER